jgi:hypothetical protein
MKNDSNKFKLRKRSFGFFILAEGNSYYVMFMNRESGKIFEHKKRSKRRRIVKIIH